MAAARAQESSSRSRPPNLVFFLVDDMGWQDSSVAFHSEPTPFNAHFRTPNMERLARRGVCFTNAYSAAVCSPSRTSLMTGQSPVRHHVTNWTLSPGKDESGETDRLRSPRGWRVNGLQPGAPTLPALLRRAGYRTIHCGKAHWGVHGTPGADPRNLGFDVNIAGHAAGAPGNYHGEKFYGNDENGAYTPPWGVPGLEKYHGTATHLTDALTAEALREIDASVAGGRPFYLYLAHYVVHVPIQEHCPYVANYRGRCYPGTSLAIPEEEARYASMVEGMDASLGRILDRLAALEVADNTLVLFYSDNGGLSAHTRGATPRGTGKDTHNWPLREGKGSAYEGGTRVPAILAWADAAARASGRPDLSIRPGSRCAAPIICEDLAPSLLAWAGAGQLIGELEACDGQDLTPLLREPAAADPDRALLFHYPHKWGPPGCGYQPHSAIRVGDWKAIYFYEPREWELYQIGQDIGETRNLAAARPEILRRLAARMRTLHGKLGAQYPTAKATGAPEPPAWPADTAAP
jgi:arylsulfatase A-like enzyme